MKQDTNPNTPKNPYQSLEQIHHGIEDYFECRLTDQQEKQLRQALASTEYRNPEIEECIAVMGFKHTSAPVSQTASQVSPQVSIIPKKSSAFRRRRGIAVAASIVAALLIAVPLLIDNGDSEGFVKGDCYAYVGGNKITDEEVIIRMLLEDLDEFDHSINQINDDFDSTMEFLSQIIEENENPL